MSSLRRRKPPEIATSPSDAATFAAPEVSDVLHNGTTPKAVKAERKRVTKLVFRRLREFAKPETGRISLALVALLCSSASNMAFPTIMGRIVDRYAGGGGGDGIGSRLSDREFFAGAFGIFVVGGLGSFLRVYNFGVATNRLRTRLREALFASLLRQDTAFFDAHPHAELCAVIDRDVDAAAQVCTERLAAALRSLSSAMNGSLVLLWLSPKLTLLSLSMIPLLGSGAMLYSKFVKRLHGALADSAARATAFAGERLGQIRTVRLFSRESIEAKAYAGVAESSAPLAASAAAAQGSFMGGLSLTINASLMAVLYVGGSLVSHGEMTVGKLASFAVYSTLVGLGFSGLSSVVADVGRDMTSAARVFELLDREPAVDIDAGEELSEVRGHVRFEGVHFRYPMRDQDVLNGLSLELLPGKVVALAGASGAGKSTVAALLCRLYDPDSGRITLDGIDLATLKPSWLRRIVGVVEQEVLLFSGTIAENIRLGNPNASMVEVERAAEEANCAEFIRGFPQGFDTPVGERGSLLSGGQRQRLAIARAILKDPPLLILDEATSALSQQSERLVSEALERAMSGRTVLVIAHRLSTVQRADSIAVLQDGRIVELGRWEALIRSPEGVLRKLMDQNEMSENACANLVRDAAIG